MIIVLHRFFCAKGKSSKEKNMRKFTLVWLILTLVIYLLSLSPWLLISLMSLISFDQGMGVKVLIILIWCYPIFVFFIEWLSWRLFHKEKYLKVFIVSALPLLPLLLYWFFWNFSFQFWWPWNA